MIEFVAGADPSDVASEGASRARCIHCEMPVRGLEESCWSCGLRPTEPDGRHARPSPEPTPAVAAPRWRRRALVAAGSLILLAVVLAALVAMLPAPRSAHGVRGLAARLRGDAWVRAEARGASADFPDRPVRRQLPGGEELVAVGNGVRTELLVTESAGAGEEGQGAAELLSGYASRVGGRIVSRSSPAAGGTAVDGVIDHDGSQIRVRALVVGSTGYLLAVTGGLDGFLRFTGSFRLPG